MLCDAHAVGELTTATLPTVVASSRNQDIAHGEGNRVVNLVNAQRLVLFAQRACFPGPERPERPAVGSRRQPGAISQQRSGRKGCRTTRPAFARRSTSTRVFPLCQVLDAGETGGVVGVRFDACDSSAIRVDRPRRGSLSATRLAARLSDPERLEAAASTVRVEGMSPDRESRRPCRQLIRRGSCTVCRALGTAPCAGNPVGLAASAVRRATAGESQPAAQCVHWPVCRSCSWCQSAVAWPGPPGDPVCVLSSRPSAENTGALPMADAAAT